MKRKKLDITKISDDELVEMFEPVYEEKIASLNNIGSYECNCKRDTSTSEVKIEVLVVGMAGSPTLEDYKNGNVENASAVVVGIEDRGQIKFKLVPEEITSLNTNDYVAIYKAV